MNYFAADIGGTDIKWAIISPEYELLKKGQFKTPYETGNYLADQISSLINAQEEAFAGVGVSVPGTLFDDEDGTVHGGGNLKYLDGIPLGRLIREQCRIPVYVENDGKSCALGEYAAGALKGCKTGLVMVIGTGIGGGIIIDGKVYKGAHCFAGEMSFLQMSPGEGLCPGNTFGSLGGWKKGLLSMILKSKNMLEDTDMDGHEMFELINHKDSQALYCLSKYAEIIAMQICNFQALLDPEIIAVGGGISNQPVLMEAIRTAVEDIIQNTSLKQFPHPKVVHCQHGNDANLLGAVYYCRQKIKQSCKGGHCYVQSVI